MSFADLGEVYGTDFVSNVQKRQQKEKQQNYDIDDDNLECNFFLDHIEKCEKCKQILKNKFSSNKDESSKQETFRSKKKRRDNSIQTQHNEKLLKRQLRQELKGKIDPDMLKELDGYDYDDMSNYLKIKNTKGLYVKKDELTDCLACDKDEDNNDVDSYGSDNEDEDGGLSIEGFDNYDGYNRRRLRRFLRRKRRELARLRRGDGDNDIIILILLGVFTIFAMDSLLKMGKKIKN